MTQEEINTVFAITISIYENEWFKAKERTRDEVQNWVRETLASSVNILTVPSGCSWGVLADKEWFDKYNKDYAENELKSKKRKNGK